MDVLVNVDSLISNNNSITDYINDYDLDVKDVKGIVSDITSIWEGSDHDTFQTKIESFMEEVNSFRESLNKYQEFINGYTDAITTLDDAYGNKSVTLK